MLDIVLVLLASVFLLPSILLQAPDEKKPVHPSFDYDIARAHEIKPHRRSIPTKGAQGGYNQLHLTITVSPLGDVVHAEPSGDDATMKFWPELLGEVSQWRFTPFEEKRHPVTAEVEEYIDLVPPERLPAIHRVSPEIHADSVIAISLERSGCFGSCPSYKVTLGPEVITFDGGGYVVADGHHTAPIDHDAIRKLAKEFVATDFYSMDDQYAASVTDNPSQSLTVEIDGKKKTVLDYVGSWVGMPAVINDLEEEVDIIAHTDRWIAGSEGIVSALKEEKFNFDTFEAQVMLKECASRGQSQCVREMLEAGVPLKPLPAPKPKEAYMGTPFDHVGWLAPASSHPETLILLIKAGAGKEDQADKDLALRGAANSGNVDAARSLIAYGANPNADLSKLMVTQEGGGMTMQGQGSGSILIEAAASGNPDMVREILRFHPKLGIKDRTGKTALFAAGEYRSTDKDGARVECVRLLVKAGADVNARDSDGNTPLHETFLTDVEEELIKLGANVNAKNNDGETPIFTTVDNEAIPLLIEHGANLNIRNNKGETVVEAAKGKGPLRQQALQDAIYLSKPR